MWNDKLIEDIGSMIITVIQIQVNSSLRTSNNPALLSKTRIDQEWQFLKLELWVKSSYRKA